MPRLNAHSRRALATERRAQILAAAARVFARKGFERATMSDVAREAGIAPGSIYNYFKNKGDLLVCIPRTFVQAGLQVLDTDLGLPELAAHMPPEQLLSLLAHNMVAVVQHNRDLVRIVLSSLPSMSDAQRARYYEQVPQFALGRLERYIRGQMDAGAFRADLDPAIVARTLPGMMFIFLLLQEIVSLEGVPRFDYDDVIATVVQVFLRGLSAAEPAPKATRRRKSQ